MERVRVAAVQTAPVLLHRDETVEKACRLVDEAAGQGARLVVFPEAFVPSYPEWIWRTRPWELRASCMYSRLFQEAVLVGGPATEALAEAALRNQCYLSIGVNEREDPGSTLFNTQLYFGPDGALLLKHRKLMVTGAERLVWGVGDGSSLVVLDTPFGRLGGLTSWESYLPLARAALYALGVDVYLAPTWDNSDTWIATLRHIAKEGRVYVIGVNFCIRGSDVPADFPYRDELYGGGDDWLSRGNSVVVDPEGEVVAGPLVGEEGVVYADVDADRARASRHQFDPVGPYARPDVLRLLVNREPQAAAVTADDGDRY